MSEMRCGGVGAGVEGAGGGGERRSQVPFVLPNSMSQLQQLQQEDPLEKAACRDASELASQLNIERRPILSFRPPL